jgi:hypothetical protein
MREHRSLASRSVRRGTPILFLLVGNPRTFFIARTRFAAPDSLGIQGNLKLSPQGSEVIGDRLVKLLPEYLDTCRALILWLHREVHSRVERGAVRSWPAAKTSRSTWVIQ